MQDCVRYLSEQQQQSRVFGFCTEHPWEAGGNTAAGRIIKGAVLFHQSRAGFKSNGVGQLKPPSRYRQAYHSFKILSW